MPYSSKSSTDVIYYRIDHPNTEEEYEGCIQCYFFILASLITAAVRALLMLSYWCSPTDPHQPAGFGPNQFAMGL